MTKPKAVTLALFCIAALLVPAHGLAAPPPPPARWTFMAYMSADNNLEHWFVQEFDEEYGKVGSDQNVNVVLLADRTPGYAKQAGNWTDTRFFYVDRGTTAADGVSWGERNMGDPATLVEFIKVVRKNYPAEKYVLLLWGHSWAWRPDETMWDDTDDDALDPFLPTFLDRLDCLRRRDDYDGEVDIVRDGRYARVAFQRMNRLGVRVYRIESTLVLVDDKVVHDGIANLLLVAGSPYDRDGPRKENGMQLGFHAEIQSIHVH